jgi:signal transduction histidine kinase
LRMENACRDVMKLLEGSFDFVLLVDGSGRIVHASQTACREAGAECVALIGSDFDAIATGPARDRWGARIESFHKAMTDAREGKRGLVKIPTVDSSDSVYSISCSYAETENGLLYLFHGNRGANRSKYAEWEKDERIKELTCLYAVAEWIEVSASIKEFFSSLPRYLATGMHYPEHAVVHSIYQGMEYGRRPAGKHVIETTLEVNKQVRGYIIVGYDSEGHLLLPEEQKMLDEIGRMLELALERKELIERLASKQAEETEYARRLLALERDIEVREKEIEVQREKLGIVNSYLDRINRDWEESKGRFETMFMAIPDKVAMIDRKRNVVMTNWEDVTSGEKCHKTFFGIDSPCVDCRLMRIIKEKSPITMEVKHEDEYFEVHALPLFNQEHEVEGIFEFYKDVTRERVYEQQLLQADKLASLGQLVSGIGHEINNPNQFIRGNIKIIEQALADMLPIIDDYHKDHPDLQIARLKYSFFRGHIMTLISDMSHGTERIKGIVEGLRRFARKDEGLLTDSIDMNTCIDATARLAHNQVRKYCDIELELAPDLPKFTGNAQKIEQVLINLVINASQAMPENKRGKIVIRTRFERGNVVVEVKDNGKGMIERTMKKIFDPFFTTRRAQGGTGLGLSIAHRIIEEHGGTISVASKIDVGTTFTIAFPVKQGAKTAPAAGPSPQRQT